MKILVFPKYNNPYQELLYKAMRVRDDKVKVTYGYFFPFIGSLPFLMTLVYRRSQRYKILHIHWPEFRINIRFPYHRQISYRLFILTIRLAKTMGFKIVWTVHNIVPHEIHTSDDLKAAIYLSQKTDVKIVHSQATIDRMEQLGLDIQRTNIIPHGNYIGVYSEKITRERARQKLNIARDDVVILFFGLIRSYKGLDYLLDTFIKLDASNKRLVIAGRCFDDSLRKKIISAQKDHNINFYEGYVGDQDVAMYFIASDVVCMPFKSITTSGSVLLALSFGKPIIAPRVGTLVDLPKNVGYLYDPQHRPELEKSLQKAINDKANLKKLGNNARKYAETLSWNKIAEQTYKVYEEVLKPTKDSK